MGLIWRCRSSEGGFSRFFPFLAPGGRERGRGEGEETAHAAAQKGMSDASERYGFAVETTVRFLSAESLPLCVSLHDEVGS